MILLLALLFLKSIIIFSSSYMLAYAASCNEPAALCLQASAMYQIDENMPTRGVYCPTQEDTEENPS